MTRRNLTFDELQEAVDSDIRNHRIRELAELFLTAMHDWPTYNQSNIDNFIDELKDYYGIPITVESIESKNFGLTKEKDVWRHTAGATIADMIDLSARFENESDFDRIIDRITDYYKKENSQCPIE